MRVLPPSKTRAVGRTFLFGVCLPQELSKNSILARGSVHYFLRDGFWESRGLYFGREMSLGGLGGIPQGKGVW